MNDSELLEIIQRIGRGKIDEHLALEIAKEVKFKMLDKVKTATANLQVALYQIERGGEL